MQTVVELSEKDIIQTIANAYDVDANKVVLNHNKYWNGQAQFEYEQPYVTAKVVLNSGGADDGAD